jgi:hypothetical protein
MGFVSLVLLPSSSVNGTMVIGMKLLIGTGVDTGEGGCHVWLGIDMNMVLPCVHLGWIDMMMPWQ